MKGGQREREGEGAREGVNVLATTTTTKSPGRI